MSKISEMAMVITELRTAATSINDAADTLERMFSGKTDEEPVPEEQPEAKTENPITLDYVSSTLTSIARISKAHSEKLRDLVRKYGVKKLSEVPPEHYKSLLEEAEVIKNAG